MLQVLIKPLDMGGYPSYFVEDPMIHLGHGYSVKIRGCDAWGKDIITLIRFKQICNTFHPESRRYFFGDICHQLRYFIHVFNDKAKIIFVLGSMVILMREEFP